MAQTLGCTRRSRFAGGAIATTPISPFISAFLITFAILLAAVVVTTLLAKDSEQIVLSDPFAVYTDIFPSQPTKLDSLLARGFHCGLDSLPPVAYQPKRCERSVQTGAIASIILFIWDNRIVRLNFVPREGVLAIGDLAALWGRPDFQVSWRWIRLEWPELHITGYSWSETGQFSYFQSVTQVSFG